MKQNKFIVLVIVLALLSAVMLTPAIAKAPVTVAVQILWLSTISTAP